MIRAVPFLATVFLLCSLSPAATLVENGQPRAVIILPETSSPAADLGSKILRDHLRLISGATLTILKEHEVKGPATDAQPWILVGEGKLAAEQGLSTQGLGAGGILLRAKGNVVAILGTDLHTPNDPNGTRYAVTKFLEKLGVRWLWPGDSGKVIPRQPTISIADFEMQFSPPIGERKIRNAHYDDRLQVGLDHLGVTKEEYLHLRAAAEHTSSESGDWFAWQGLGGSMHIHGGHAFGALWGKHGKTHPEWFALQPDGTRDQSRSGTRSRLCVSNTELIHAIAQEKIAELKADPTLAAASIAANDGSVNSFCSCPKCEALDAANARKVKLWKYEGNTRTDYDHVSLTDRMVYFWNGIAEEVAKECPGKMLSVYAYSVYSMPPVQRKLNPNLVVFFVPMSYLDDADRANALKDWDAWSQMANKIFFRPNLLLAGRRDGMPMLYPHKFAEDFRFLASHKLLGTDFDSCMNNWATQGLNYYVVARLNWDPNADVNAMIDDYCKSGFGPGATAVRKYFDKLESITNQIAHGKEDLDEAMEARRATSLKPFTPAALEELHHDLADARSAAANDPAVLKRLAFLEEGLHWTEVEVHAHELLYPSSKASKEQIHEALDARATLMREILEKDPLAVNTAYIGWGEDNAWGKLGWKPAGKEAGKK